MTRDCAETVSSISVPFSPAHVEFDTRNMARFIIHDRDSDKMELYVTENYGETFNKGVDYTKSFFWHYDEVLSDSFVRLYIPTFQRTRYSTFIFNSVRTSQSFTSVEWSLPGNLSSFPLEASSPIPRIHPSCILGPKSLR